MNPSILTDGFAVSEQISADDVETLAGHGYSTIICNRPDEEEPGQPPADAIARACREHGIEFHYLPFQGSLLPPGLPEAFAERVNESTGPVLAYCRSGQRCSYLWMVCQPLLAKAD